jgi:NADH dehydrogenase FAD-containing subunit
MRIVILGAGFAGLELATLLSEEFGEDAGVVLRRAVRLRRPRQLLPRGRA